MTILDVIYCLIFPIFADSRLALAIRVLPFGVNLFIVFIHFADGVAIIVSDQKPTLVIFKQFAHGSMLKVVVVNGKVAIRIHALEHFGIFA